MKKIKKGMVKFLVTAFVFLALGQTSTNTIAAKSWWNNSDETTKACRYLVQNLGFTRFAAAGILGNFKHESNVNPYVRERIGDHNTYSLGKEKADQLDPDNDGFGPGWGLAQWGDGSGKNGLGSGRWINLLTYTNARKGTHYSAAYKDSFKYGVLENEASVRANIPTLYEQLDFVKYEMRPNSGYVSQAELNTMTSIEETSDAVLYRYEKSSTKTEEKRRQKARDIYLSNCSTITDYDYKVSSAGYIDSVTMGAGKLKIRGWHAAEKADSKTLRYMFIMDMATGKELKRLPISNVIRDDVNRVIPYLESSKTSGFNVETSITKEMKGKTIFIITRYLIGENPNASLADKWFIQNPITIPTIDENSKEKIPVMNYQSHVQNIGWQPYVKNGVVSGTIGKSLRLESFKINVTNIAPSDGIKYSTHVQNIGWQNPVSNNQVAGTVGKSLRVEAIKIQLTGELKNKYDIYYRVHTQNYGWLGWAKNGENAGSEGKSLRMEALEVKLIKKGDAAPKNGSSFVKKDGQITS